MKVARFIAVKSKVDLLFCKEHYAFKGRNIKVIQITLSQLDKSVVASTPLFPPIYDTSQQASFSHPYLYLL